MSQPSSPQAQATDDPVTGLTHDTYQFPSGKLRRRLKDKDKVPLVLVACGSFSPITFLHLRMFPMAADYCRHANTIYEVIGGYLSPVSDGYQKAGLAPGHHRVRMCELATQDSDMIMVDPFEAISSEYIPTARVLDHFEAEIRNALPSGVQSADGTEWLEPKIALLSGADLVESMSVPNLWSTDDLKHILGKFGVFCIERHGTDVGRAIAALVDWKDNIHVIHQVFQNNMSSTQIRLHIKRDMSVRYLIPGPVVNYIEQEGLYRDTQAPSAQSATSSSAEKC